MTKGYVLTSKEGKERRLWLIISILYFIGLPVVSAIWMVKDSSFASVSNERISQAFHLSSTGIAPFLILFVGSYILDTTFFLTLYIACIPLY